MDISLINSESSFIFFVYLFIHSFQNLEKKNTGKEIYLKFLLNAIVVVERIRRSGVVLDDRLCIKGADWAPLVLQRKMKIQETNDIIWYHGKSINSCKQLNTIKKNKSPQGYFIYRYIYIYIVLFSFYSYLCCFGCLLYLFYISIYYFSYLVEFIFKYLNSIKWLLKKLFLCVCVCDQRKSLIVK